MTDPRWTIRSYLRLCRWPQEQADTNGLVYRGPTDFVLQHGRWWKPLPVEEYGEFVRGAPRCCFGNSIGAAVLYGLRYIQGWALSPITPDLVVPHGWNADAQGRAIDLTWWPPGTAYLGVEFSVERADDATWYGDADVLEDYIRGWPLLRERWQGETEPDPAWEPSHMLLALRARVAGDQEEMLRQLELAEREEAAS